MSPSTSGTESAAVAPRGLAAYWAGGVNPYGVPYKKMGMWLFILSDSLTFGAALMCYAYLRVGSPNWPRPFTMSSIALSTTMTMFLLSSSLTMVLAVHYAGLGRRKAAAWWIVATMGGGIAFMGLHLYEWSHLIHEGMTFSHNPWGSPMFGGTFFTLTGLHMFHVFTGVCYLGVIATGFGRGKFESMDVEVSGLYWHFVDLVWMFVFPLVYLLSVQPGGGH